MSFYYFPYSGLINAVTSFILGLFVLFKNFKSPTNRSFFYFTFSVGFWAINYFFWLLSEQAPQALFFIRSAMIGAILISPTFVYFVMRLLNQKSKILNPANFALAGIFIYFSFGPMYIQKVEPRLFFSFWPVPGILFHLMLAYFLLNIFYAHMSLWQEIKRTQGTKKIQIKYIFFGGIIAFGGGCTNYLLWYNIPIYPAANILVTFYVATIAYAIVRHQLMNIEVIIKKTLVFAGLFVAAYAVFASFAYLGSAVFENVVQNRWIAMVPSVLIVVLMLRPLENFLKNATDKYLFQKKYDYRQLLRTFSDEVLMVLDLNMLVNLTVNKLAEIVKLDNASIMLYDEEKEGFKMAASVTGKPGSTICKLSDKEDLIFYMRRSGKYILLEGSTHKKFLSANIEEKMHELNSALVIPLMHHKNMVGILSLGKKKSDEEFTQDDIDILLPLARTLSIAITNAQLFEKLSEAQAQAAQREKMAVIGTLSAGINHEICNPLGIARGQCEMFLLNLKDGVYKGKSPEELLEKAQEIMKKVMNETDRATVITKKLSSFAKPAKGEIAGNVRVEKELDEVISLVEHDLKLENIIITKEIRRDLPCVSADRKQLQEIFFNIVRNAAQSIKGNGKIIIRVSSNNGKVHIDIEDSGVGISKHHLDRIFNPFFTTKEPGRGAGLGLFIVKQIVERNNGHISVRSELGNGTCFSLSFNAVQPS